MARQVDTRIWIGWNNSAAVNENASNRLLRASGEMALTAPGASVSSGRGIISQATIVLDNSDGRYSPLNTSSSIYSSISSGKAYHSPCEIEVTIDGGSNWHTVFSGVIKIPQETGPTVTATATSTIDARSNEERVLQKRISTTNANFVQYHDNSWDESWWIARMLADAGLVSWSSDNTNYDFVSQFDEANGGPTATLDPGLFIIPWVWADDESAIEECWQLAAACGGRFYAGPDGLFYYENAQHWLFSPHNASSETINLGSAAESKWETFQPFYSDRELYDKVTVEVSPRVAGGTAVIWQPEEDIVIPPSTTKTVTARFRQPAYIVNNPTFSATTHGGVDRNSSISITLTKYAQSCEMDIENTHATDSVILRRFSITGQPIVGGPTVEESSESSDSFWSTGDRTGRTWRIRGNPYLQLREQASFLAEMLRDRHETPTLSYRLRGVPGDPERQLGDRITVQDSAIMSSSRGAFITKIAWRINPPGGGLLFVQDIDAIDAASIYPNAGNYFIVGSDTLGGTEVLFY